MDLWETAIETRREKIRGQNKIDHLQNIRTPEGWVLRDHVHLLLQTINMEPRTQPRPTMEDLPARWWMVSDQRNEEASAGSHIPTTLESERRSWSRNLQTFIRDNGYQNLSVHQIVLWLRIDEEGEGLQERGEEIRDHKDDNRNRPAWRYYQFRREG